LSELIGNRVQNAKDVQNISQANKVNQYDVTLQGMSGAVTNFQSAMDGLWEALGLPAAKIGVTILNNLSVAIRNFTQWVGGHPGEAKAMVDVLLGLGAALTILGGAAIVGAIAAMVGGGGLIALLVAGIAGLVSIFLTIQHPIKDLEAALNGLGGAFTNLLKLLHLGAPNLGAMQPPTASGKPLPPTPSLPYLLPPVANDTKPKPTLPYLPSAAANDAKPTKPTLPDLIPPSHAEVPEGAPKSSALPWELPPAPPAPSAAETQADKSTNANIAFLAGWVKDGSQVTIAPGSKITVNGGVAITNAGDIAKGANRYSAAQLAAPNPGTSGVNPRQYSGGAGLTIAGSN
jgi:hypothetical protein